MTPTYNPPPVLELIRALAIAWKNLSAYPPGHPALSSSMALAHRRLSELLARSGLVTLGVARDGLVAGEEKVTSSHAQDLARALYLREVALLVLEPGIEPAELEALLRLVTVEPGRGDEPLARQLGPAGVTHARVESVDYSALRVTDEVGDAPPAPPAWDDLLRAILADRALSPEGERLVRSGEAGTPRGIAQLLREALAEEAGRPAGGRPALGERLAQALGKRFSGATAEKILAANQIAELVRAMPEEMRAALLAAAMKTLASEEAAGQALALLADAATPDTVLQALRQIKDQVPLSSHALRLLHALGADAPATRARHVEPPDPALLAELSVLFHEEDIDRYNPEEHNQVLTQAALEIPDLARVPPLDIGDRILSLGDDAVADHMTQAAVEMLGRIGGKAGTDGLLARLEGTFREGLARGEMEAAVVLAEDVRALGDERPLRAAVQAQVDETLARMAAAESLRSIVDAMNRRGSVNAALARRLMDALGEAAARGFLLALAEEPDKSRRRRILELLVAQGPAIAPLAREGLGDERWYVVRNMIIILQRLGDRDALPRVRLCATAHPDLRVRLEAIKFLLAFDPERPLALLAAAIHDPDPKMAEAAVSLAGSYGIREAVGPLLQIVEGFDLLRRREPIRLKAIKALGELGDPAALPRLERFFRNWTLPLVSLAERRAAFRSLHAYPPEARAAIVERGARFADVEIRRTCLNLMRGGVGARGAAGAGA